MKRLETIAQKECFAQTKAVSKNGFQLCIITSRYHLRSDFDNFKNTRYVINVALAGRVTGEIDGNFYSGTMTSDTKN